MDSSSLTQVRDSTRNMEITSDGSYSFPGRIPRKNGPDIIGSGYEVYFITDSVKPVVMIEIKANGDVVIDFEIRWWNDDDT